MVYTDDKWGKEYVTCQGTSSSTQLDSDIFKVHPESTIYTTNVNQVVGGSDYYDKRTNTYKNIPVDKTNVYNDKYEYTIEHMNTPRGGSSQQNE